MKIKMTETEFTKKLRRRIDKRIPHAVVFKIADRYTIGIPDTVITYNGFTSWWEIKVARINNATLSKVGKGIQNNTAQKLALEGICYYIVFRQSSQHEDVLIVEPKDIEMKNPVARIEGYDYDKIVDFIEDCHK